MTVTPITSNYPNATARSLTKTSTDYDNFLQLLVTELKNQDPTKPLDPTQMVTQLATFSSVEQAVKTNSLLSALGDTLTLSQGSVLIGRTITSEDGAVSGPIRSVTTDERGLVAMLKNGSEVPVTAGASIS